MRISGFQITIFLVAIVLGCLSIQTRAEQSLDGFQGLIWGDTAEAVLKRFPSAELSRYFCLKPDVKQMVETRFQFDCELYEISSYKVGEYDFRVVFFFTAKDKKLKSVSLNLNDARYVENVTRESFQAMYSFFAESLIDKYGEVKNTSQQGNAEVMILSKKWRFSQTKLELKGEWIHEKPNIMISYSSSLLGASEAL